MFKPIERILNELGVFFENKEKEEQIQTFWVIKNQTIKISIFQEKEWYTFFFVMHKKNEKMDYETINSLNTKIKGIKFIIMKENITLLYQIPTYAINTKTIKTIFQNYLRVISNLN